MIKVEHVEGWGFEHAIRGMRNPLNSWKNSDTRFCGDWDCDPDGTCPNRDSWGCCGSPADVILGPADLDLMRRLYNGGSEHRKYLRQIMVSMDITAPFYWWKEFDTYKIGTTANSCSTMHKITAKPIELSDFSADEFEVEGEGVSSRQYFIVVAAMCETMRKKYLETGDRKYWRGLIQLLPNSYNQKRTVTMNYENAVTMIHQRSGHKLLEWREFTDILRHLPWLSEIMGEGGDQDE